MKKNIKILFGFDEPAFERGVVSYLEQRGYEVVSDVRFTKTSIRDFVKGHPQYDAAVLLEALNNSREAAVSKYSCDELAMLTDDSDINIIVVLNSAHKGSRYMEALYTAGITSAIYQKGRKGGATPKDVAELILNKRSRRDAREYYGLGDKTIELDFLGNDTFRELYDRLGDPQFGSSLVERFINVCMSLSQKQVHDFIRRLPSEVLDELVNYEEFHTILEILRENGLTTNIKRPRHLQIGLDTPEKMGMVRLQIAQNSGMQKDIQSIPKENFTKRAREESVFSAQEPAAGKTSARRTRRTNEDMSYEDMVSFLFSDEADGYSEEDGTVSYNDEYRFTSVEHKLDPLPSIDDEPESFINDRVQRDNAFENEQEDLEHPKSSRKRKRKEKELDSSDFISSGNEQKQKSGSNKVLYVGLAMIVVFNLLLAAMLLL